MSLIGIIGLVSAIISIIAGLITIALIYDRDYLNPKQIRENVFKKRIDGIIPKFKLGWTYKPKKNRKESFAVEILNESVTLDFSDNNIVNIRLYRDNVDKVIITTKGKKHHLGSFFAAGVNAGQERINSLLDLDNETQEHLIKPFPSEGKRREYTIREQGDDNPIPFRWASGGLLSIVSWKKKHWVPVFFRDIPSIGWNIALGASERRFTDRLFFAVADNVSLENELNHPKEMMIREFLEESFIITCKNKNSENGNLSTDPWFIHPILVEDAHREAYEEFIKQHRKLRSRYDMKVKDSFKTGTPIRASFVQPKSKGSPVKNMLLVYKDKKDITPKGISSPHIILFNTLDLGIEYIKIVQYDFPENGIFLDGEIFGGTTLIRMPVAFISLDYIEKTFNQTSIHPKDSDDCSPRLEYDLQNPLLQAPSVRVENAPKYSDDIKETDIYFFMHDIERRRNIYRQGGVIIDKERDRTWFMEYDKYFPGHGDAPWSPFGLFTYATCRSFQQLVSMLPNIELNDP